MMRKFIAGARLILICIYISLYLIVIGIPVLTYCRVIKNPRLALRLSRLLARMVLWFAGIKLIIEGKEKVDPAKGCVYIANHKSFADSVVLFYGLPGNLTFLAKKEIYKIPLVSFALRTMDIIEVDRSNSEAAAQSIERAVQYLRKGKCVILFPEGTRNRGNGLLPFKKGAFVLAIKAQVPIIPVVILGAERAIAPDTILLYPATIRILIQEPIETNGLDLEQRTELLEHAQSVIEKTYLATYEPAKAK